MQENPETIIKNGQREGTGKKQNKWKGRGAILPAGPKSFLLDLYWPQDITFFQRGRGTEGCGYISRQNTAQD